MAIFKPNGSLSLFAIFLLASLPGTSIAGVTQELLVVGSKIEAASRAGDYYNLSYLYAEQARLRAMANQAKGGSKGGSSSAGRERDESSEAPKCTRSGGVTSIVVDPVNLSFVDIAKSNNVVALYWEKIADNAQKKWGGKVARGTVYVQAQYSLRGVRNTIRGPIYMDPNKSVYESIINHVRDNVTDLSADPNKIEKYRCRK